MSLSPIVIFGYNRPGQLRETIATLARCEEAKDSELYIFIDGARTERDKDKVAGSVAVAQGVSGEDFAKVTVEVSEENRGLGASVIRGVNKVIKKYGRVIVLEDDLLVQPNFLTYMNTGLARYAGDCRVFSVCGYTNTIKVPEGYPYDTYFAPRSSSWGWGTWADRWETVKWDFSDWERYKKEKRGFNKWGGSDCFSMLSDCRDGINNSWAIRFCFSQYLQGATSLFPIKSLVTNEGFDGKGTNCKSWSRFRHVLGDGAEKKFSYPAEVVEDPRVRREVLKYHSIPRRIYSKLMYIIHRSN